MELAVPAPLLLAPLPKLDPSDCAAEYAQVLAEIYYAEQAALRGFIRLADPLFVRESDIFLRARNVLIRDEQAHVDALKELIAELGYPDVPPPAAASQRLWEMYEDTSQLAFPVRASVGAMICLFGEGLGYALLYHLAQATREGTRARKVLDDNLADELPHLKVSMQVVAEAYKRERTRALAECSLYAINYAFAARMSAREQRARLEALGFDYFALSGSMLRFVRDLLVEALKHTGVAPWSEGSLALYDRAADFLFSPASMRLGWMTTYLPKPPGLSTMVKWYGQTANWIDDLREESRVVGGA